MWFLIKKAFKHLKGHSGPAFWIPFGIIRDPALVTFFLNSVWDHSGIILAGGKIIFAGGKIIWAGGKIIWAGGKMISAGGENILAGGKIILAGEKNMVICRRYS